MSYQVLARKWRPRSFATLVGQDHVVRALTHALEENRLHHAWLFTGTRGVGKTTLARILAKALNCERGVSATPCGQCGACNEIDGGRFVDLLEVDAATNTRVEEMRVLLENAVFAPTRGRYKVYVIDEVHMLSTSAFNAMLKTLEEPPEHVKFILATTDPQKIPVTVLSRCLQFNLKQMPPALIVTHLEHLLTQEQVSYDLPALQLIARSASGSMRDALSLLDQAIAHGAGQVLEKAVRDMLGTIDQDFLLTLVESLVSNDGSRMLAVADAMAERSLSFSRGLQELAALLTRVQLAQLAPQSILDSAPERAWLLQMAPKIAPELVQLAYQIVIHGRKELHLAPDEQTGFVMTLLRLLAFAPASGGMQAAAQPPVASSAAPSPSPRMPGHAPAVGGAPQLNRAPPRAAAAPAPAADPLPASTAVPPAASAASISPPALQPEQWSPLLARLPLSGMARELAQHCELRGMDGQRVLLRLAPMHRHLQMKPAQDKLQQVLADHFAQPLTLSVELAEVAGATPAAAMAEDRRQKQAQAVAAIESDPFVREVIETFDARLIEASIAPITPIEGANT